MDEDQALLDAWRDGDKRAGNQLVSKYYSLIERFFLNKVPDSAAADLIQRTFLKLLEGRDRIRETASLRAYLLGIARNLLYQFYDRRRRDGARVDFATQSAADLGPSPTTMIAREQEAQLLFQALRRIPLESQMILELYYWESMRAREIAALLEVPEGTARTRIRRAKQLLERELERVASSPELLQSTVSNLESWALRLRRRVGAEPS